MCPCFLLQDEPHWEAAPNMQFNTVAMKQLVRYIWMIGQGQVRVICHWAPIAG
jgi:hypothetical protein